ncbi:hypothetical protein ACFB49_04180 [Sphingomonas sp. DBB INV C78]|uniref:hypothetical protein n=1 Tax=Sphingomonas sp. DBB INV C78 TaxID=3349434 RepID=UPI0036D2429A
MARTIIALGLALLMAVVAIQPAQARWLQAETANFRIYSEGSEAQLRKFAVMLEDYDQVLRMMTGGTAQPAPAKLDIYLVSGTGQLRIIRPVVQSVAGFYMARWGSIAAFAIRRDGIGLGGEDVLLHEYAHHFMMQYYPVAYPVWYVEGFAEFMMTANLTDSSIEVGRFNLNRAYWLTSKTWLPMERVLDGDLMGLSADQLPLFYAQSWLVVHWAFRTPGKQAALHRYLAARAKGEDGATAFQREMGMDYKAFARELRRYAGGKLTYVRFTRPSEREAVSVAITPLPPAADELLLPRAAIRLGPDRARGAILLEQVRREAVRYPADPFAMSVLAAAELDFGSRSAGTELLDKLIAGGARDGETLFLRGYAELVAARRLEGEARAPYYLKSRKWFARAFRANPNYVPALMAYVESRSLQPMDDNTLNVLLRAQALAPQVDIIRFDATIALLRKKQFDAAAGMIEPLAANPHGGRPARFARDLLARARERHVAEEDLAMPAEDDLPDEGRNGQRTKRAWTPS